MFMDLGKSNLKKQMTKINVVVKGVDIVNVNSILSTLVCIFDC